MLMLHYINIKCPLGLYSHTPSRFVHTSAIDIDRSKHLTLLPGLIQTRAPQHTRIYHTLMHPEFVPEVFFFFFPEPFRFEMACLVPTGVAAETIEDF